MRLSTSVLLAAAVLGACSDQPLTPRGKGPAVPVTALQAFDCVGTRSSLRCEPASGGAGEAAGVVIDGQNTFVRLTSSNVSYDSGTELFTFDATVQNLMNEAMGTPDGTVSDPEGIQVFFSSGPTVTGGTGTISVVDAGTADFDGYGTKPYYAYNEILDKDEVSQSQQWKLSMPPSVTSFSFRVLLETDVQYLLVINEVMVNPVGPTTADTDLEWFEVYNAGSRAVDLQNLVVADSAASGRRPYHLVASSVPVASGGYVVLGNSTNTTLNGGATVDYAYGGALALANSLDAIKIARPYGLSDTLTVDRTQYASAAVSAQSGISRELKNPALDNSNMDGSNWADALVTAVYGPGGRGTPKAQNSTFTP
ncbi:MAG TPA: lamin tail domain-containing protein [Longimicrobium sp.]|nr:lamin tail domain-containing protein [Longimicrobium sp.]